MTLGDLKCNRGTLTWVLNRSKNCKKGMIETAVSQNSDWRLSGPEGLPDEAVRRKVITHLQAECCSDAEGDIIMEAAEAKWAVA